jgi:predicted O-methyltransferase YrrM
MVALATAHGWKRGAELGTGHGHLARQLLAACPDLCLIVVDYFRRPTWRAAFDQQTAPYRDRLTVHQSATASASAQVADGSLDFVFIDAGHGYRSVRDDIAAWWPKVTAGGWFGGHDYSEGFPGVIRAVRERFGRAVRLESNAIWRVTR